MRELGMTVLGCLAIGIFFVAKVYPDLEYTGHGGSHMSGETNHMCIGDCYKAYVAENGTAYEIEMRKQVLASADEFSSIKPLWSGCAACHGPDGGGGVGPKLAGQTADYITGRLNTYKNKGEVGPMSAMMWGQAGMLSSKDMEMLGKYIETL